MRIQNTNGQYWTGECWGVEQAAVEYATYMDLPLKLDDGDSVLLLTVYDDGTALYYENGNLGDIDPTAAAR